VSRLGRGTAAILLKQASSLYQQHRGQNEDEKANRSTHCMQCSATAPLVVWEIVDTVDSEETIRRAGAYVFIDVSSTRAVNIGK